MINEHFLTASDQDSSEKKRKKKRSYWLLATCFHAVHNLYTLDIKVKVKVTRYVNHVLKFSLENDWFLLLFQ